jgi:uncharacterized membrane protein YgcG
MAYTGVSIIDYLKSLGQDSSMTARKALAQQSGIANYSGTAAQNTQLLNLLRNGAGAATTPATSTGGASSSSSTTTTGTAATAQKLASVEAAKPAAYQESDMLKNLAAQLANKEANKPDPYQSKYQTTLDTLLDQILNREKFSYDLNADALYNQYKDQYVKQGNLAMQDTMANAAALTGGYGNSYASTAGNQAYQTYLGQLNNKVPELYNSAYGRYKDEGTELYNKMGLVQDLDSTDYGRYRDNVSDYYADLEYYYRKHGDMSAAEYNKYRDNIGDWQKDRDYFYGQHRDSVTDEQWQKQFDTDQERWAAEFALAQQQAASKGSSGGSGRSGGGSRSSSSSGGMSFSDLQGYLQQTYHPKGVWNTGGQTYNDSNSTAPGWLKGADALYQQGKISDDVYRQAIAAYGLK